MPVNDITLWWSIHELTTIFLTRKEVTYLKILIDGDACPQQKTIVRLAKKHKIPVHIYCDYCHKIEDDYAEIFTVDSHANSADIAIANHIVPNDIVVTNDIGLASLVLAMKGHPINNQGVIYTKHNINLYTNRKYMMNTSRRKLKNSNLHTNLPKRPKQKQSFYNSLSYLIRKTQSKGK